MVAYAYTPSATADGSLFEPTWSVIVLADDVARVAAVLRDVFGYESFRFGQAEAAATVMAK